MDELERIVVETETSIKELMARCEEAVIARAAEDAYTITEDIEDLEAQETTYNMVLWCIRRGARLMVEEMNNMLDLNK